MRVKRPRDKVSDDAMEQPTKRKSEKKERSESERKKREA
jgi:hypothetical protein